MINLKKFGNLLTLNKRFSSNVNKLNDKIVKQKNKKKEFLVFRGTGNLYIYTFN